MGGAHNHRPPVADPIVDAVRQRDALGLGPEVMSQHALSFPAPSLARVEEVSQELALLAVDADHWLATVLELVLGHGDVLELGVALRMLRFADFLAIALQREAILLEKGRDRVGARSQVLGGQGGAESVGASTGPLQARHRISRRVVRQQGLEPLKSFFLCEDDRPLRHGCVPRKCHRPAIPCALEPPF